MSLAQQRPTTLEEYEALPEDIRAEVFDGQIQYMVSPSQVHQDTSRELLYVLTYYLPETHLMIMSKSYTTIKIMVYGNTGL